MGRVLDLPVIHLDRHYWRPGWVETPKADWVKIVNELCAQPGWVMDGNYGGTMATRLAHADAVVFLDLYPLQCFVGLLRRRIGSAIWGRPDLPEGCPDKILDAQFLTWVANYNRVTRPKVLELISHAPHIRLHHLRSRSEMRRFLEDLKGPTSLTPRG